MRQGALGKAPNCQPRLESQAPPGSQHKAIARKVTVVATVAAAIPSAACWEASGTQVAHPRAPARAKPVAEKTAAGASAVEAEP